MLLLALAYAGGYISQFIINYQVWTSSGGTPGNGTSPEFPSAAFSSCLKALTVFPYSLYGLFLCLGIFGLLVFMVMRMGFGGKVTYDKERNLTYSDKGTYGTSGFMTDAEMQEVLELVGDIAKSRGVILGKLYGKAVCLPEKTRMNRNVAVFGASGSMKSRAYARNVVFQCVKRGESLIITDPKSELYADLCLYLQENGYTVRVFNLINPENSDSWNCLAEIEGQEIMAQLFCDVIIKNTGSPKGDHFWDNSEMNLLKALVLYVDQGFPPEGRNIGQVYKLLTMNSEKELNSLFDLLPVTHPAKAPYNIFKQASDTVRSGVIIGLGTRLQVFQNRLIRQITSYNEINLTQPGREKCAYFCITSDQDSTFDFLSSLFMSFVFIKLVRYADKYGEDGKLPVPVHILADELANGGCTIADLTKKISTIRSRRLSISCIFQNLPQMQNRYPLNQWQEIIGNCDTQLFYGYYYNPDAFYDYYSIGGRWQDLFLVKDSCTECSIGERSCSREEFPAPEGYKWVCAARKKDIEWQAVRDWHLQQAKNRFRSLEKLFLTGERDKDIYGITTADGIYLNGRLLYQKGDSEKEYLSRHGYDDIPRYPAYFYAFLGENGWQSVDDIVTESGNETIKNNWQQTLEDYLDSLADDTVLIGVDCHM